VGGRQVHHGARLVRVGAQRVRVGRTRAGGQRWGDPRSPRRRCGGAVLVLSATTKCPAPTLFRVDPDSPTKNSDKKNLALLKKMLSPELKRYLAGDLVLARWTALEKQLLVLGQAVADQVLRGHAAGFSTTKEDLLHDLVP
jgi:hypothetical protein